jgi:GNAT acetyltransferase-like protein
MAVHIRLAQESDVENIAAIYRPIVETTAISFETVAPNQDEMRRRIGETLVSYPWLVCDLEGRIAGYAYATRHRVRGAYQWSVDTSVMWRLLSGASASDVDFTSRCSASLRRRDISTHTRGSRFRIQPASRFMSRWDSRRSACTIASAISSGRGMT